MNQNITSLAILAMIILVSSISAFAQGETFTTKDGKLLTPMQQVKSGILVQDIVCKPGLTLVVKSSDDSPACVKPSSEQRLLEHGWILPKLETTQVNHSETAANENVIPTVSVTSNTTTNTIQQQNTIPKLNDTSKPITNVVKNQNITLVSNDIRNATGTNSIDNENVTPSMIYKLYKDWQAGADTGVTGQSPLPALQIAPTVSSTNPNSIKILMIGMSPSTLKVGDRPQFTLTWQNISNKTMYATRGYVTSLGLVITPSDNALMMIGGNQAAPEENTFLIQPKNISTNIAWPDPTSGHLDLQSFQYSGFDYGQYQITKPGTLHVTMELFLRDHGPTGKYDIMETVQFDVNATQ